MIFKTVREKRPSAWLMIAGVYFFLLFPLRAFSQEKSGDLDKLFSFYAEKGRFSGVVLAAEKGRIIYHKAFGFADFEDKTSMDPASVFSIASATKPFTALGVMILKEKGILSYDDPLTKYIPDFPDYGKGITLRHLLTHTSGVKDYANELRLQQKIPVLTDEIVLEELMKEPALNFPPGERYSYSNSGYFLLAMVIEKVTGETYGEFMEKNIFQPAGMKNTTAYGGNLSGVTDRVKAYSGFWQEDREDLTLKADGAGNIYSTAEDLFLFDQALYGDSLVRPEILREAYDTTGLMPINKTGVKYGFGWHISSDETGTRVYHHGGIGGFRCQFWRDITRRNTLIVLSNNTFLAECPAILSGAQNIMMGKPYTLGGIPVSELFFEWWYLKGYDTAMAKIRREKNQPVSIYDFSEDDLNNLGLIFLFFKKKNREAVGILEFMVELYPDSWNAHDSLAEAYLAAGDKKHAADSFRKSLELNPDNKNAENRLKELAKR